ncbi:MAG TPA: response regulator [Synergistaceae bacterium]|nr:response regulator [Synergistaceae bacterium]HPJ24699.1 response regulator [Synergistaceae bacterium]HPQ37353.1 response regulator [Synergistaceae bacterium]
MQNTVSVDSPHNKVLLIADDDAVSLRLLSWHLREMGEIVTCLNGTSALEKSVQMLPDMILLDVAMPEMNGYEVCRKLKALPQTRNIPVIFITGMDDEKAEAEAFAAGAVDFVTKPFKPEVLRARTGTHLELKGFRDELEKQVRQRTRELQKTQMEILRRLAMVAEYRDSYAEAHLSRMRKVAELLCRSLGMDSEITEEIASATILHDLGKIAVPDSILLKPGKLTPEEYEVMKRHPLTGGELLEGLNSPLFRTAREIALTHHEKWNGTGYPAGLAGEEIPLGGRIVALCDVFDALIQERPYKSSWTPDEAFQEISRGRGTHFDPDLTDLFLSLEKEIRKIYL